jgi:FHS family glucose/mannose:H+ symporter-like MFS transporter
VTGVRRAWLTGGAYAGMFVFGIVMALLGAVLPLISKQIGFDLAGAGNLFLVMNFAMLLSMLSMGLLIDRLGQKPVLVAGSLAVAGALALLANPAGYGSILGSAALLGFGGGALNGATNTLVSDLYSDPREKGSMLNLLGVFFGFGALFLPFTIGALLEALGLGPILYLAVALSAAPAAVFLVLGFPPAKQSQGVPFAEVSRLARNPLVLLIGFLLFFQSGNEFVVGGFLSSYLTAELGSSIGSASYLLAAYWGAIMLTRLVSSRLLLWMRGTTLVLWSAACSALAVTLLITARTPAMAGLAVVLIGVGFASIYPTTLSVAGSRFEAYSGTVFGIIFTIALVGGMTMPWAVGHVAAGSGLRLALVLPVVNSLMILGLQVVVMRALKRSGKGGRGAERA